MWCCLAGTQLISAIVGVVAIFQENSCADVGCGCCLSVCTGDESSIWMVVELSVPISHCCFQRCMLLLAGCSAFSKYFDMGLGACAC
jgi:hypothetical protein